MVWNGVSYSAEDVEYGPDDTRWESQRWEELSSECVEREGGRTEEGRDPKSGEEEGESSRRKTREDGREKRGITEGKEMKSPKPTRGS